MCNIRHSANFRYFLEFSTLRETAFLRLGSVLVRSTGCISKRRRFWGNRRASLEAKLPSQEEGIPTADSALDRFLLERYRFWARRKLSDRSSSALVNHRPYDAHLVRGARYEGGLFEAWGMNEPSPEPIVAHYCKGFPVSASAPSWAFGTFGQANHK